MPDGQDVREAMPDSPRAESDRESVGEQGRDFEVPQGAMPAPVPERLQPVDHAVDPDDSGWNVMDFPVKIRAFYRNNDPRFIIKIGCQEMILDDMEALYVYIKQSLKDAHRYMNKTRSIMKAEYAALKAETKK